MGFAAYPAAEPGSPVQKKLIVRIWLSRLGKYLLIPAALCVVLFPLYSIFHQQTIRVQLSDAEEQLATAASTFDNYLYNIRFVTNKLFHDPVINVLAASRDGLSLWNDTTAQTASKKLEDLTYSMSPAAYSYVTFARSQLVIDNTRFWRSYANFYPGTLEYSGVSREDWRRWLRPKELTCQPVQQVLLYQTAYPDNYLTITHPGTLEYSGVSREDWRRWLRPKELTCQPVQQVLLYQTAYPDNYLTITQPFFDSNNRFMGSCTMLLRERQLIELFLPMEEWRSEGLFYITRNDGQLLQTYHYDPATPLPSHPGNGPVKYNGQEYLLLHQALPDLDSVVTVGLPYSLFSENLTAVQRGIWLYLTAGLAACLVLSTTMTLWDMRYLRPVIEALDQREHTNSKILEKVILHKLNTSNACLVLSTTMTLWDMRYLRPVIEALDQREHTNSKILEKVILHKLNTSNQLAVELERNRNQIEHGRMEMLLRTGYTATATDQALLREHLQLTTCNYLLMIPAPQDPPEELDQEVQLMLTTEQLYQCSDQALLREHLQLTTCNYLLMIPAPQDPPEELDQEVQLMLTTEQLYQCYGQRPYVHNSADGSILAIVHLEDASGYPQLLQQTALLHDQLEAPTALTLSAAFSSMEQLSGIYWQVRNAALNAAPTEKVLCLSSQDKAAITVPEVTVLERLREHLLSGQTEQAQDLVRQMFGQEVLRPQDFQQIFFSVRGILLNAAEKTDCEDITFLCNYDRRQPMQKLIQNLCDGDFQQIFFSVRGILLNAAEKTDCEDITFLCNYDRRQPMQKLIQNLCDGCLVIGGHMDSLKQSHNLNLQKGILQWLGEHYQNPDLNAAMVADQFQISKKYVSQFLKDQTGKSYNEYVEDLRLNHAMQLLKTSGLSVTPTNSRFPKSMSPNS